MGRAVLAACPPAATTGRSPSSTRRQLTSTASRECPPSRTCRRGSTWPSWPCRSGPSSGLSTTAVGSACVPSCSSPRASARCRVWPVELRDAVRQLHGMRLVGPTPSGWSGPAPTTGWTRRSRRRQHRAATSASSAQSGGSPSQPSVPGRASGPRSLRARGHRRRGGRRRARRARLVRRGPGNRPRRPLCGIGTGPAGPGADRRAPRARRPVLAIPAARHGPGTGRGLPHRPVRHPGGAARGRLRRCGYPVGARPDGPRPPSVCSAGSRSRPWAPWSSSPTSAGEGCSLPMPAPRRASRWILCPRPCRSNCGVLPTLASVGNPVDTSAAVGVDQFAAALTCLFRARTSAPSSPSRLPRPVSDPAPAVHSPPGRMRPAEAALRSSTSADPAHGRRAAEADRRAGGPLRRLGR